MTSTRISRLESWYKRTVWKHQLHNIFILHYRDRNKQSEPPYDISTYLLTVSSMVSSQYLSTLFAALATAIGLTVCCPIGQCIEMPSISTYYTTALVQRAPIQARVNVTATSSLAFQPHKFDKLINVRSNVLPPANGCEDIFNFSSRRSGLDTPCPWNYQCDYNPQRIPAILFRASCESETPQESELSSFMCREVHYPISYITTTSCDPLQSPEDTEWRLEVMVMPTSCNLQPRWS